MYYSPDKDGNNQTPLWSWLDCYPLGSLQHATWGASLDLAAGVGATECTCVFVEVSLIKAVDQYGFQAGFTTALNCSVIGVTTEVTLALVGHRGW